MSTKATNILLLALIALVFGVAFYIYPALPPQIASHWDIAGNANGYLPKFWGVFLFPILLSFLFLVYWAIPKLDPKHANIGLFRNNYNIFWIVLFIFFTYIFKLTVLWNYSGVRFNLSESLAPALALLYFTIGWLLAHTKQNWFIGIRTPWTLSSERVWDKTHQLGGLLFKIAAVGPLIVFFMPNPGDIPLVVLLIGPVALAAIISVVYSYLLYRAEA